jgi:hypothetical protein
MGHVAFCITSSQVAIFGKNTFKLNIMYQDVAVLTSLPFLSRVRYNRH